uniref:Integrin-alpha FG-GAP repeat-containing protein 2-like n=2 Tax=Hirondellea gigas TaxID=1518452 RepID=A0A2P2HXR6_9CRUS
MASALPSEVIFKKPLVLEFEGNMFKHAITLGDVDNDGLDELVVANDKGDLAIFKGENPKPVRFASELGFISCVAVGDLINLGRNVLLAVSSCGMCYVYDFLDDPLNLNDEKKPLKCAHSQQLPANIKMTLIGDINGDGFCEMVVALSDRIVRTYKWQSSGNLTSNFPEGKLIAHNKWELSEQVGGIALNRADNMHTLLVSQPGPSCFMLTPPLDTGTAKVTGVRLDKSSIEFESLDSSSGGSNIQTEIIGDVEFEEHHSFDQFKAASSAAFTTGSGFQSDYHTKTDGNAYALASLNGVVVLVRGGKIVWKSVLEHSLVSLSQLLVPQEERRTSTFQKFNAADGRESPESSDDERCATSKLDQFINPSLASSIAAMKSSPMAMSNPSTPSKMTIPIPNSKPKRLTNSMKYGTTLATKLVACATNGATFILNAQDGTCVRYKFHDAVRCCTSGFYGVDQSQKSCIVYVTHTNQIYLYHDVRATLEKKPTFFNCQCCFSRIYPQEFLRSLR